MIRCNACEKLLSPRVGIAVTNIRTAEQFPLHLSCLLRLTVQIGETQPWDADWIHSALLDRHFGGMLRDPDLARWQHQQGEFRHAAVADAIHDMPPAAVPQHPIGYVPPDEE